MVTTPKRDAPDSLEAVLADLKAEQYALGDVIRSLEKYLAIHQRNTTRSRPRVPQQQPQLGLDATEKPNAVKGTISIRKAIAEVLRDTKRKMKAEEIWDFAYEKGARTNSKRPASIVALTCNGMAEVEKTAPREFKWRGE